MNEYAESTNVGENAEKRFLRVMTSHQKIVSRFASWSDNAKKHKDFFVRPDGYSCDVKAIKSVVRGGPKSEDRFLVEWLGIMGFPGWVRGEQDFIAFEIATGFVLVRRNELETLVSRVNWGFSVSSAHPDKDYTAYNRQRFFNDDEFCYVPKSDILDLPSTTFILDNGLAIG